MYLCPPPTTRLFQVPAEEDALNWFPQYALKLRPFYETLHLKAESTQPIVDCLRSHPDWSSAHIAVDRGLRECLKHNYIQRSEVIVCVLPLSLCFQTALEYAVVIHQSKSAETAVPRF